MPVVQHPGMRELLGPMADESAEEDLAAGGDRPAQGAAPARVVGEGGGDAAAVVGAAPGRGPRKEIPRDVMSVHGRRIDDLCRWGWSYTMIGKVVRCNVSALSRMRSNPAYHPHYLLGLSLTKLWIREGRKRLEMRRNKG